VAEIKFGLSEFAAYMAAGAGSRRTQLTAKKFPKEEDKIPSQYYAPVVKLLRNYHVEGHKSEWLELEAVNQDAKALSAVEGVSLEEKMKAKFKADKHGNFARVLRAYKQYFSNKKYRVLEQIDLPYSVGNVRISIRPDLHVIQGKTEKLIKFWCKDEKVTNRPKLLEIRVMTQLMLEAANMHGHLLSGSQILLLDVETGETHKGAKLGAHLGKDIIAECQTMEAVWPTLKKR
jgi:hypothetical protein